MKSVHSTPCNYLLSCTTLMSLAKKPVCCDTTAYPDANIGSDRANRYAKM